MSKREQWLDDPLGYLIGADRVADFHARIYEREALVVAHNDPKRFDGLLSIDDVDRIVTNVDLREGQLDLADETDAAADDDKADLTRFAPWLKEVLGDAVVDAALARISRDAGQVPLLEEFHDEDPALTRVAFGASLSTLVEPPCAKLAPIAQALIAWSGGNDSPPTSLGD